MASYDNLKRVCKNLIILEIQDGRHHPLKSLKYRFGLIWKDLLWQFYHFFWHLKWYRWMQNSFLYTIFKFEKIQAREKICLTKKEKSKLTFLPIKRFFIRVGFRIIMVSVSSLSLTTML